PTGGNKGYYANPNDVNIGSVFYSPGMTSVTEIDLPAPSGGISYQFGYDSNSNWGEIGAMILPSGAKASYQYWMNGPGAPYSAIETKDVLMDFPMRKDLVYRPEYDLSGGNSPCNTQSETCLTETWLYSYSPVCCVPGGITIAQTTS